MVRPGHHRRRGRQGEHLWFGLVITAAAAANQHTLPGFRRNYMAQIAGTTMDIAGFSSIAQDSITFAVGWRHAMTYTGTEDMPDPAPQSALVLLADGAQIDTLNIPGVAYTFQPS